jgi:hypothetical protein
MPPERSGHDRIGVVVEPNGAGLEYRGGHTVLQNACPARRSGTAQGVGGLHDGSALMHRCHAGQPGVDQTGVVQRLAALSAGPDRIQRRLDPGAADVEQPLGLFQTFQERLTFDQKLAADAVPLAMQFDPHLGHLAANLRINASICSVRAVSRMARAIGRASARSGIGVTKSPCFVATRAIASIEPGREPCT